MHKKSFSARARNAQAPAPPTYHQPPDVAAFVAAHGVTKCEPGQTSRKPTKPFSAKRRKRKGLHHESWTFRRAYWKKKSRQRLLAWIKGTL
jgi:hypothetical protein